MRFVIGDVHGEISKLTSLMNYIFIYDKNPELIFIGDYLDKGDNPRAVLDFIINLSKNMDCTFLLGNHEHCWMKLEAEDIKTKEYLAKYGGIATLKSLGLTDFYEGKKILMSEYGDFFASLKPYWKSDSFIAVHSGIKPENYSIKIENIRVEELLFNRYDFISHEELYMQSYRVIFGHTGFFTPFVSKSKIGIDTAACFLADQPISSFCIDKMAILNSDGVIRDLDDFNENLCPNIIRTSPWRYDN
ncbi:MAG: metallophosphoesterase [Daejeonella sp.]|uniref:metallophosphoesterase n=1 Tax=Daejeonella sp. TaxID=2805397 RepID=UPI002733CFAD|nr:metallophosphoesterase [Daejeonella sp.]MDP3467527.1 metallophosphoesterase [Daejeonella sp.]